MTEELQFEEPATSTAEAPPPGIYDLLRKRHEGNEWVLIEEVSPGLRSSNRYADAVAVNLWPSRGHQIIGYEVKVSRADWLRELKQPEKAEESVFRYCDRWYVVAAKGIVKPNELPAGWGLIEQFGSQLRTTAESAKLSPEPITRAFFASLVRRGFEALDRRAEKLVSTKLREAETRCAADAKRQIDRSTHRHKELQEAVARFTEKTGLKFTPWDTHIPTIKLALALEKLNGYGEDNAALAHVARLAEQLEAAATAVRDGIAAFNEVSAGSGQTE
jgi:hypothetical protein